MTRLRRKCCQHGGFCSRLVVQKVGFVILNASGRLGQNVIPTDCRKHFFKKRMKNIASGGKRAQKRAFGGCNAYVVGSGAAAHGRTHFHSRILINKKKGATHNGTTPGSHRGVAGDHTFRSNAPRYAQERSKGTRTADGTRDDERV